MPPEETPEINVEVVNPAPAEPKLGEALEVAREIAKSDEILSELRGLYSVANSAIAKIDALESRLVGVSAQVDGVAATVGALLVQEIKEPEPEELAEEIAEEIVTELATEEIPAVKPAVPESAPPEEKKTRKRGFF
jgi:hypothetical protein